MYEKLYRELLIRYNELERENNRLRQQLGLTKKSNEIIDHSAIEVATVNKYSSSKEKIDLFRSLFKGRDDVFARRWQSATSGKSGYQPVCENEWAGELCDKRKYKCANCPNRKLKALSDEDLFKHLSGKDPLARDVIGVYPMLQDETCRFLCADFDDDSFEKDISAFREVCNELDVPVCIERSRSGNGAHAWIFFDSPITASTARKLGSGILTRAMEKRGEISFKSYDRLFPNQDKLSITDIYKKLSENEMRNNLIVADIAEALNNGRNPIVLTERREHVALLAEKLSGYCKNVIQLVGTASAKDRRVTLERLEAIPDDESVVIVATGKYVGEGFDYPRLDTLFLALPIAWKGKVAQYAGRLHRNYEGKTEVQVYDYVDIHIPVLERMYQKRVKSYSAIGYKTKLLSNPNATPDLIYDGKSFYQGFCNDLLNASAEILIVSPFMRKSRVSGILKLLSTIIESGIAVTVVTRPPEDFKEKDRETVSECSELLLKSGVTVKYKSNFHQKFTVIDQSIVWYGSVNFLSFGTHEESIMRFENTDIAGQLMDTVL